jgi:hypothetical protein
MNVLGLYVNKAENAVGKMQLHFWTNANRHNQLRKGKIKMAFEKLTDLGVRKGTRPGTYSDGRGLSLQVTEGRAASAKAGSIDIPLPGSRRQWGLVHIPR